MQLGLNYNYYTSKVPLSKGGGIVLARVNKVILGPVDGNGKPDPDFEANGGWAAVGSIFYTILYTEQSVDTQGSSRVVAKPLSSNFKQYPLVNEIVEIVEGPSTDLNDDASAKQYYYRPPYNLWGTVHHNAFPNLINYGNVVKTKQAPYSYPLGSTFQEKSTIKNIQPFEGDIIVEGRWGQSIRFGSTVKGKGALNPWSSQGQAGSPITIIRNGQATPTIPQAWVNGIEDISNDDASIYLCSGQSIYIQDLTNFKLTSYTGRAQLQDNQVRTKNTSPVSTDSTSPSQQSKKELAANK